MKPFKMVALWCWYRGERYHGFQGQDDLPTIQRELLRAYAEVGLERNPVVAGRTDKGVSARMQVLSCRVRRDTDVAPLTEALNARLPEDIGIAFMREVPHGFHASWSASSKEYRYTLTKEQAGDLALLREAAALVPGTRNYKVFHFKSSDERLRTVTSVEVIERDDEVMLRFLGEGFARHMVRMLVGGMTAVSTGAVPLSGFIDGLERQTNFHCPTAPAEPLTLWSVGYPVDVDPFTEAERRDFAWPPMTRSAFVQLT